MLLKNNSNTKTWIFSLLGKYTGNSKISLSLVILKIVTLFISPLNELHALSFYKPLVVYYLDQILQIHVSIITLVIFIAILPILQHSQGVGREDVPIGCFRCCNLFYIFPLAFSEMALLAGGSEDLCEFSSASSSYNTASRSLPQHCQ